MILGVDVFSGYGVIDWKKVAAAGVRFAWVKCTEGNEARRNDSRFTYNVAEAMSAGIAVGAYHFSYPLPSNGVVGRSPVEQAERFFDVSKGLGSRVGELSPALDMEWPPSNEFDKWGCKPAQVAEWCGRLAERVSVLFGRTPIIYTYPWWWKHVSQGDVRWAAQCPLWMANYTHAGPGMPIGKSPTVPKPWASWAAWQFSADGSTERIPGIPACPVDRDCIKDETTFDLLTGRLDPAEAA